VIRIAAVGDLHAGPDSVRTIRPRFEDVTDRADVLLLAGDLTRRGTEEEGRIVAAELRGLGLPVIAVLGNHDHHSGEEATIRRSLEDVGVRVLERQGVELDFDGTKLGVAGTKGFGGGFVGASASAFGEREMKSFIGHTEELAAGLEEALAGLRADVRVALTHYAPVDATLAGERLEIFPFLGSYLLAEAIDRAGADLAIHGHAHRGTEKGVTAAGVTVRNVAETVIGHAYKVYRVGDRTLAAERDVGSSRSYSSRTTS
jgi:Icc-related predicted phosphoesterase